jgi:hypothetical protein
MERNSKLKNYVCDLFRWAIRDQIDAFKEEQFTESGLLPCAFTGWLIPYQLADVDHGEPYFATLVFDFLRIAKVVKIPTDEVELARLLKRWRAYHAKHAKLRISWKVANRASRDKDFPAWKELDCLRVTTDMATSGR